MNNPNLAVSMKKRRQETIARQKRKREQREYVGNISVRNIVRNLAKLSKEEQEKVYSMQDLERNNIFKNMHKSVLGDKQNICTYEEGLNIMNTISIIQEQNNR